MGKASFVRRALRIAVESTQRRIAHLLAACGTLLVVSVCPAAAQTCPADCGADGMVTVDELLRCVNIALGSFSIDNCPPCDGNADGMVTVDELIKGVNAVLVGCEAVLSGRGVCLRPGPSGLAGCAPGTAVSVSRCDDRQTCLDDPAGLTMLGTAMTDSSGNFSVTIDANAASGATLVFTAEVDSSTQTKYRLIDFGAVGAAGARDSALSGHGAGLDNLRIDPNGEAAVRLLDAAGLATFADDGIAAVIDAVRSANADNTYAGLAADTAADVATDSAGQDATVMETVQQNQMTLVDVVGEGAVVASSVFGDNEFPATLAVDGDRGTSWFSNGAADGPDETFRWTGAQDDVIVSLSVLSNAENANPQIRGFGFGSVRIQVLTAGGESVFDVTRELPGDTDPDVEVFPDTAGRSILLTFHGHDDPSCGGFSELQVVARRALSP